MDEALRVYSWRGILTESTKATDVKSRADARKMGPFADFQRRRVSWVRWTQLEKTGRWRRAHFRHLPRPSALSKVRSDVCLEIERRDSAKAESVRHKKVKEHLAKYLKELLAAGRSVNWAFLDKRVSNFSITGDLLADVVDIQTEYPIHTPFGKDYKLDIALLGSNIVKKPIVLGAIEIEFTHEFEMSRCLICKALGFPLVCIDITEPGEEEFSEKWIESTLVETTKTSLDERRRNYIYIHDTLYPVYMNLPSNVDKHHRHQFIVFVDDKQFDSLLNLLNVLKESLGIAGNEVLIQPVPCKNDQMRKMLENEGSIAGHDWFAYNGWRYIRVTLDRPINKSGLVYKYHLAMASILNSHYETLVGYKYRPGIPNDDPDDPLWQAWVKGEEGVKKVAILPKHVSEPLRSIMLVLDTLD